MLLEEKFMRKAIALKNHRSCTLTFSGFFRFTWIS